ncbi:ankyrin repeat domain-containing protein [Pantoea dispersa]|uniref:ankyrin repeat domain-containing protein n=2 Tax=Erwiniaceae TaxID=1903409 RepID=UPI0024AFC981|nr:ankyrin repeat domain-containing protein [Pantoea dispersa]MDI6635438.1 ankyrin repeat domain-containing protein [Pantoea dispersa]
MKAAVAIREGNAFAVDTLAKVDILNMSGKKGMTLLMYALLTATNKKTDASFQIVTELVKKGADPLYIIPQYGSAADAMARSNDPRYLKALIAGGLDKNAVSSARPLIMNATSENSMPVLEYLVSIGADVNKPDTAGKTALIFALTRMDLDQVEYLLHHGANPNAVTKAGWGFSNLPEDMLKKEGKNNDATALKLMEIKRLAVAKGMRI